MTEKYEVTATKKYGTTYHGRMTTKEPGTTNGLISIARRLMDIIAPDEISDIRYIPVAEDKQ